MKRIEFEAMHTKHYMMLSNSMIFVTCMILLEEKKILEGILQIRAKQRSCANLMYSRKSARQCGTGTFAGSICDDKDDGSWSLSTT